MTTTTLLRACTVLGAIAAFAAVPAASLAHHGGDVEWRRAARPDHGTATVVVPARTRTSTSTSPKKAASRTTRHPLDADDPARACG
jgi:hypothetical protein